MNIVKLKDIIMPDTYSVSEFFNKNLKGKYAYWVKMRYIFPLDSLDYKTYIAYEQMSDIQLAGSSVLPHIDLYSEDCCMMNFAINYIDATETELVNSIHKLHIANSYSADYDTSVDELRIFRTWLAEELLKFNIDHEGKNLSIFTDDQMHMLEYYKNSMYNDVIKYLSTFGNSSVAEIAAQTTCGCCSSINNISDITLNTCDAVKLYKDGMHAFMVSTFSNIEFWLQFTKEFLMMFKKRIDNILTLGFTIPVTSTHNAFTVCKCSDKTTNESNDDILRSLSKALGYIIDDKISGNKNFINDTLRNWSSIIYEKMYWKQ